MRFCMTLGVNKQVNKSKNKKTKIQKKRQQPLSTNKTF